MRAKKWSLLLFTILSASCSRSESKKPVVDAASTETTTGTTTGTETNTGTQTTTGTRYQPTKDVTWQWQLKGTINTSYNVSIYDIDLFDTATQTIRALQAQGKKVICYFSAGSSEDWRDDFSSIPEAVKGKNLDNWPGEKWLDVRHPFALTYAITRLDLAKEKGCDGVEPDNVDGFANDTGFPISAADQLSFLKALASAAHDRNLAIGLKNNVDQVDDLVSNFDFAVNEECHQYDECEAYAVFIAANKPVLNAEYGASQSICAKSRTLGLRTLILPLDLDDSSRISCD